MVHHGGAKWWRWFSKSITGSSVTRAGGGGGMLITLNNLLVQVVQEVEVLEKMVVLTMVLQGQLILVEWRYGANSYNPAGSGEVVETGTVIMISFIIQSLRYV